MAANEDNAYNRALADYKARRELASEPLKCFREGWDAGVQFASETSVEEYREELARMREELDYDE